MKIKLQIKRGGLLRSFRRALGRLIARVPIVSQLRRLLAATRSNRVRINILEARLGRLEHLLLAGSANTVDALENALRPHTNGHTFKRFGNASDGGYVLATDFGPPDVAISIGVGSECDSDDDLAEIGARVWQFDHTVSSSPSTHPAVTFVQLGLSKSEGAKTKNLHHLLTETDLMSHEEAWLMLDAEGVEWDLLHDDAADVSRFAQISIEFHLLSLVADAQRASVMIAGLNRLRRSHVPVAWHVNNSAPVSIVGGKRVPDVLEVTFVRNTEFVAGLGSPDLALFSVNDPFGPEGGEAFAAVPLSDLGPVPEVLA